MAWTLPTALFFSGIALALVLLTLAEWRWPTTRRRGVLGLSTTRGDRFFISLLVAAFAHVAWVGGSDLPVWWVSLLCVASTLGLLRWG